MLHCLTDAFLSPKTYTKNFFFNSLDSAIYSKRTVIFIMCLKFRRFINFWAVVHGHKWTLTEGRGGDSHIKMTGMQYENLV